MGLRLLEFPSGPLGFGSRIVDPSSLQTLRAVARDSAHSACHGRIGSHRQQVQVDPTGAKTADEGGAAYSHGRDPDGQFSHAQTPA